MKFGWKIFQLLIIVSVVMFFSVGNIFAGKIQQQLSQESTLEQIMKRGALRVGFDFFTPWAAKNKKGEYFGMEIDVARKLAEDMGVEIEFIPTKWAGIIPALLTGKFDIIIGGMSYTPERNLKVNFSDPYYMTIGALFANKKLCEPFNPKKLEDFNRPEVVFSQRTGVLANPLIKKVCPKAKMRLFDDHAAMIQEVRNGKAHASLGDAPTPFYEVLDYPETLYLPFGKDPVYKLPTNFALRKGDLDWLNYVNNWILYRTNDGWLQERYEYYFTTKDWESQVK